MTEPSPITDLLKVTSRLSGVLEREIEMLRGMKPTELQALQQDKIVLTAAYEAQVKALRTEPDLLGALAPELRAELKTALEKFQKTLAENERSLRAAKETTERVLRAIADEIEKKRHENSAYSASGVIAPPSKTAPRQPVSVAIDERL